MWLSTMKLVVSPTYLPRVRPTSFYADALLNRLEWSLLYRKCRASGLPCETTKGARSLLFTPVREPSGNVGSNKRAIPEGNAMKAAEVMVSNVITVGLNNGIEDVAAKLLTNHISAVPVVDGNGALVGIVSECDLMRRPETGTRKRHSWWLE